MFNPTDVFPLPNLSDASTPWARKLTEAVRSVGYEVNRHGQLINGNSRASSAQLGLVSRQLEQIATQVTELQNRSTSSTKPADIQLIRGTTAGTTGPVTRAVSLPAPNGGARNAIIYGSGSVTWTGTTTSYPAVADAVTAGVEFRVNGSRVWFGEYNVGSNNMFSFQASPSFSVVVPVQASDSGDTYDLRMWVARTSSGGQSNAGARLENMNFTISYGDKT